jgi:transposase
VKTVIVRIGRFSVLSLLPALAPGPFGFYLLDIVHRWLKPERVRTQYERVPRRYGKLEFVVKPKYLMEGHPMRADKYVGLDVDKSMIVAVVEDREGRTVLESVMEAEGSRIRGFFETLCGNDIHVTFEEGTQATWLHDLIYPLVKEVIVCNPRKNKLIQTGNKGDKIDAKKLARLLRMGELVSVYHGENSARGLKELVHGYNNLVSDTTRIMSRIKAIYRGRGIKCKGHGIYRKGEREEWQGKLGEEAVRRRVGLLFRQLDNDQELRKEARKAMLKEAAKEPGYKILTEINGLGPIRSAIIIGIVGTPDRFRTKRQFWPYCGLGVVTKSSSDYEMVDGQVRRKKKPVKTMGLNRDFSRHLKYVFKSAAIDAIKTEPFKSINDEMVKKGMRPEMARLTIARKISAIALRLWKKGERFDAERIGKATQAAEVNAGA